MSDLWLDMSKYLAFSFSTLEEYGIMHKELCDQVINLQEAAKVCGYSFLNEFI